MNLFFNLFFSLFFLFPLSVISLSACREKTPQIVPPSLVIYTYDSFMDKGGLGPEIQKLFEQKCQCKIEIQTQGDVGQLVSRLEMDSKTGRKTAQIVVGLDQFLFERAKPWIESWGAWVPKNYAQIPPDLKLGSGFLPMDYGVMTFLANREVLKAKKLFIPKKLKDLLHPEWKKSLLLQDPRTSSPGLVFLHYTEAVLGKDVWKFWKELRFQWLTLAPSWSSSYQLFLKGEAPLVWTYVSSQAYHRAHGDSAGVFEALVFEEGNPLQVEGAAWVKDSTSSDAQKLLALGFLEFLISDEIQRLVPKHNWMMPVIQNTQLPVEFQSLPQIRNPLRLSVTQEKNQELLKNWGRVVSVSH